MTVKTIKNRLALLREPNRHARRAMMWFEGLLLDFQRAVLIPRTLRIKFANTYAARLPAYG